MPDIGWSEMALIALVALIVIGPKELPNAMRAATKWIRKARSLAREFQSGVDDMVREADLEDARKAIKDTENFDIKKTLGDTIDPTGEMLKDVNEVEKTAQSDEAPSPAEPQEPASNIETASDYLAARTQEKTEPSVEAPLKTAPDHSATPAVGDTASASADNGTSKSA